MAKKENKTLEREAKDYADYVMNGVSKREAYKQTFLKGKSKAELKELTGAMIDLKIRVLERRKEYIKFLEGLGKMLLTEEIIDSREIIEFKKQVMRGEIKEEKGFVADGKVVVKDLKATINDRLKASDKLLKYAEITKQEKIRNTLEKDKMEQVGDVASEMSKEFVKFMLGSNAKEPTED